MSNQFNFINEDFKNVYFVRERNTYKIMNGGDLIKIETPIVNLPFGIEVFKTNHIVNFEINPKKDNETYNFTSMMMIIDNYFKDLLVNNKKLQKEFVNDLLRKQYYPIIKDSLKGKIVRCQIKEADIVQMVNGKYIVPSLDKIKGSDAKITFDIQKIWYNNNQYGIILNIRKIELM